MKISIVAVAMLLTAAAPAGFASTASEREYQRGYNDCLHGRYDQNQHGESYKKGCRAAEDGQKSGAPSAGHAPAKTSGASKAKVSDLKGMDSIKAVDVMTSRGFTNVDTLTAGEIIYGTYCNAKTHQCVQLTSAHDRIESIDDVPEPSEVPLSALEHGGGRADLGSRCRRPSPRPGIHGERRRAPA